jgi:hypothetical protein
MTINMVLQETLVGGNVVGNGTVSGDPSIPVANFDVGNSKHNSNAVDLAMYSRQYNAQAYFVGTFVDGANPVAFAGNLQGAISPDSLWPAPGIDIQFSAASP